MVGYKFMGKAHAHAYRDVPFYFESPVQPVLKAICGRNEEGVKGAANKFGFESYETNWRTLIQRDDIDLIDIVTPNNTHAEIVLEAVKAGKHVICEKPLAMNLQDAKMMLQAAKENGVVHMITHNYRFAPAVQFAKKLITEGKLGKIYHIRASYLQDWIVDPDNRGVVSNISLFLPKILKGELGLEHKFVYENGQIVDYSTTYLISE